MNLSIPDDTYDKFNQRAIAAGYSDATELIEALAKEPTEDPRGALKESALRESVDQLDRAENAIDAGQGIDGEDAARRIAGKHGFSLDG